MQKEFWKMVQYIVLENDIQGPRGTTGQTPTQLHGVNRETQL